MACVCYCYRKRPLSWVSGHLQIWKPEEECLDAFQMNLFSFSKNKSNDQLFTPILNTSVEWICSTHGFNLSYGFILSDFCKCFLFRKVLQKLLARHCQLKSLLDRSMTEATWESSICAQAYLHNSGPLMQTPSHWPRKLKDVELKTSVTHHRVLYLNRQTRPQ